MYRGQRCRQLARVRATHIRFLSPVFASLLDAAASNVEDWPGGELNRLCCPCLLYDFPHSLVSVVIRLLFYPNMPWSAHSLTLHNQPTSNQGCILMQVRYVVTNRPSVSAVMHSDVLLCAQPGNVSNCLASQNARQRFVSQRRLRREFSVLCVDYCKSFQNIVIFYTFYRKCIWSMS